MVSSRRSDCEAADAAARQAKAIADKADKLLNEAADNVQRLKISLDAAQRAATAHHADVITRALQAGIEPSAQAPPEVDMAPLSAAVAHLHAMEKAALVVRQEYDKAAAAASQAAATCHKLVDDILDAEAVVLAAELVAATRCAGSWKTGSRGLLRSTTSGLGTAFISASEGPSAGHRPRQA